MQHDIEDWIFLAVVRDKEGESMGKFLGWSQPSSMMLRVQI
jgi:hypothetical protein